MGNNFSKAHGRAGGGGLEAVCAEEARAARGSGGHGSAFHLRYVLSASGM